MSVRLATNVERLDNRADCYSEGDLPDMSSAKVKILQIKFDTRGKVRGYHWSASRR